MPRRKQTRQTTVKDIRAILRLTHDQGLSVREVSERLKISKTTVSTYLLRAREAGLSGWPLPPDHDNDAVLGRLLFHRMGRPPQDLSEPDWALIARELKRKGVTLTVVAGVSRRPSRRLRLHLGRAVSPPVPPRFSLTPPFGISSSNRLRMPSVPATDHVDTSIRGRDQE
jgi:hypothetical protein